MKINILSQGITPSIDNSVGTFLIKYLSSNEYHTFTGISAFASVAGINGLSNYIEDAKSVYKNLNIIVGVDQKGTSKEALYAIFDLGINSGIYYHKTEQSIFHPKIYLFEGEHLSQLIIGSSNLTARGLFANVEASIHLELSHENQTDLQIISELKASFIGFFDFSDPNLQPITPELIERFVLEKIVSTEAERKEIQAKINEFEGTVEEKIEGLIKNIFPPRKLPSIPSEFRNRKKIKSVNPSVGVDEAKFDNCTLVWQRRKLPTSSVEIAGFSNTNPTGGLRLVQDKFQVAGTIINQTIYFRNEVFGELNWVIEKQTPLVEIAIRKFEVIILGENLGVFPLKIRHKPSGEAGQHNYTTLISWGELNKSIQEKNLTNRLLNLYRFDDATDTFRVEIL